MFSISTHGIIARDTRVNDYLVLLQFFGVSPISTWVMGILIARAPGIIGMVYMRQGFPGGSVVKNLPANAGDTRDMGLISGSRRFPGEGNGSPLQWSCLENPMDRRAWWTICSP